MTNITAWPARAALLLSLAPASGLAQTLPLPSGAVRMAEDVREADTVAIATGPFEAEAGVQLNQVSGAVTLEAWRMTGSSLSTLQLMNRLAEAVEEDGFETLYRCRETVCGGFDFRFALPVLPAPEMYVNLNDYRYLAAQGPGDVTLSLLVSRSAASAYVQILRVVAGAGDPDAAPPVQTQTVDLSEPVVSDIARALERDGRVILSDMRFATGSDSLGDDPVASLDALAEYLKGDAARRIVFVGHTDATGSLSANQALSRRRAQAAVTYLRRQDVPAGQISSDGVGYLAPLASNLTEEGRRQNRRVEAVLLP